MIKSNVFKVKNVSEFDEKIKIFIPDIIVTESGYYIDTNRKIDYNFLQVIKDYIDDNENCYIIEIQKDIRTSKIFVISNVSVHSANLTDLFKIYEKSIFPRKLLATVTVSSNPGGYWIERGKEYIAVGQKKERGRSYYIIKHSDGVEKLWNKECFE